MPFLRLIAGISRNDIRKAILKKLSEDPSFLKALREIAKNTVRRKINLSSAEVKKLQKHKRLIASIAKTKNSIDKRRKLAVKSGGFLPILIPLIATIIGEVIKSSQ